MMERKIFYIWKTNEITMCLDALFDFRKVYFAGYVVPQKDTKDFPESFRGFPVISDKELAAKEYDYILAYEADIFECLTEHAERIICLNFSLGWRSMVMSPEHYITRRKYRYEMLSGEADRYQGAITGMSYIQRGILCEKMNCRMAMLGAPSQDLFYDYLAFTDFYSRLHDRRNLQYAVIGLAPYSFRYDLSLGSSKHRCLYYYYDFGELHHFEYDQTELLYFRQTDENLNTYMNECFWDVLYNILIKISFNQRCERFRINECTEERRKSALENLANVVDKPYISSVRENELWFEKYLAFCREQGLKVVVLLPVFSELFRSYLDPGILTELITIIEEKRKKYGFTFLNLYADPDFKEGLHFADEHHVNVYGAEIMTKKLQECLDQLG